MIQFLTIPTQCPYCGGKTKIRQMNNSKELICDNINCQAKLINRLDHFCGIKGLDIKGLSKATLEKLIDWNWINKLQDIYTLSLHSEDWYKKHEYNKKSVDNVLAAIEASKNCTLDKFISAIGIPLIGNTVAKDIAKQVYDYGEFRDKVIDKYPFYEWDGFGTERATALWNFDYTEADEVHQFLNIQKVEPAETKNDLGGKVFVITGRLVAYANREALKKVIEEHGGKVANAISGNTSYLINNDIESTSTKNKAAKDKGIPIISEEQFNAMI